MISTQLAGQRVLLTQADDFMGPALVEVFGRQGAEVIADTRALADDPALPAAIVAQAGRVDVLLLHLALPAPATPAGLRGQKRTGSYSAARGAQLAYVQAVGLELAPQGVQLNAIAQNFVANPTCYGPEVQADPRFQERLKREVPLGRLVSAEEDALFAAYLCSDAAACFVGQVFPVSGGWALR
ncbi:MAG: hypothetical protein RLZZ584_1831 [Pseudomonadota bacterium]|jgi:NAD(P)-dependent dehydrogenase (short-subunit alcohol dehydrogenase family)